MFKKNNKNRPIKKIFQWREYLNWKKMTRQQKINFKRACLFPFAAYFIYAFLLEFTYPILIIIFICFLARFKNKNKLTK